MSDSVRPHRWQPTRLPHPWDSPDKNTGVGCHFLLQCMKVKSESEVTQSCPTQRPHGVQPTRLLHPWDFPGKSTGVGCHCLLRQTSYLCLYFTLTSAAALPSSLSAPTFLCLLFPFHPPLWIAFPFPLSLASLEEMGVYSPRLPCI